MAKHPNEHEDRHNNQTGGETASKAQAHEQAQADEKTRAEGEKKLDDARKAMFEREQKGREDAFKADEARIAADREAAKEAAAKNAGDTINELAATGPHFVVLNEPHHGAEFILSEANGQRSRGAAYFADPTTIYVGMPVKKTAEATATQPATYVPAAVGADCMALCIYAGGSIPGEGLRTAVIVRDAEVNKNLISWGAITAPEQVIGAQTLATNGIIAR
jgi:hypothetical protein